MTTLPKISVVTVSFNQGEFIRQNIESVLQQNYPNFEHIIVDGGSTDSTVDVLKSYPHLSWTSEPDNGQTDALNRGFARATGDIIGWLNSDDWYAPGAFHEVVKALENYPVVLGACEMTDKDGVPTERVENVERTWYDILKYWVYYSVPAQPSIFFTREVLEGLKRHDGKYLDEDLEFTMDFELWLRMADRYDFTKRIDRVLSYYRMYETNKTGQDMAAVYREMSRVFHRHANRKSLAERDISFVIPVADDSIDFRPTLDALQAQSLQNIEVLVVSYSDNKKTNRSVKRKVIDLGAEYKGLPLRFTWARTPHAGFAVNSGIEAACAPVVCFLTPGATVDADFAFKAVNLFQKDTIGLCLPVGGNEELRTQLTTEVQGVRVFNLSSVFSTPALPPIFLVRKAALLDIGGFRSTEWTALAMREMLIRLPYKAWQVDVASDLCVKGMGIDKTATEQLGVCLNYVNAKLLSDLKSEFDAEPFAKVRAAHGFSISFGDDVVKMSRTLLDSAPSDWYKRVHTEDVAALSQLTQQHPRFSPGWYHLAKAYRAKGQNAEAQKAEEMYRQTRSAEEKY